MTNSNLDLHSLNQAISHFEKSVEAMAQPEVAKLDLILRETLRAGIIQNFEITYELCWKFMKRWLEIHLGATYVEGVSRRELFRLSAESQLIENIELWLDFHQARNLISQTYQIKTAEEIFEVALQFVPEAQRFLKALQPKA